MSNSTRPVRSNDRIVLLDVSVDTSLQSLSEVLTFFPMCNKWKIVCEFSQIFYFLKRKTQPPTQLDFC